jgi:hypothetical protein
MNWTKKKSTLIFSAFALALLALPASAGAACNWTIAGTKDPCPSSMTDSDFSKCQGERPAQERVGNEYIYYYCCCDNAESLKVKAEAAAVATKLMASTPEEPRFNIPELQIEIPGMERFTELNCAEGENCEVPWIAQYISGLYKYGFSIAGILATIMLMAAGLLWTVSAGDASRITQAKNMMVGSITGLIILGASYLILQQVNPELVNLQSIDVSVIKGIEIPEPEDAAAFTARCKPTDSGNCAAEKMSIFGDKAQEASAICMAESSGRADIHNSLTRCKGGEYAVIGLFQFNLSANYFTDANGTKLECNKAFDKAWTNSSPTCKVIDDDLYEKCKAAASNPELSIKNAKRLLDEWAKNGKDDWGPWEANTKFCHF